MFVCRCVCGKRRRWLRFRCHVLWVTANKWLYMKWVPLMCILLYIFIVHYPNVQLDLDAVIKLWKPHRFTKPATGHWHHFILHFSLVMVFLVFKFFIFIFQNSNCDLELSLCSQCVLVFLDFSFFSLLCHVCPSYFHYDCYALYIHCCRFSYRNEWKVSFKNRSTEHTHTKKNHQRKIKTEQNNTFRKFSPYFFFLPWMECW